MQKNIWKKETLKDMTAWDLNCRHAVKHTKGRNELEKKFRRKNRRKVKIMLDILIQTCYNTITKKKGDNNMDEIMRELAMSIADTKRDEITAVFNDYKEYMDVIDIARIIDKAFHDMIWNIEKDAEEE